MISIIIPILNESENVNTVWRRITESATSWKDEYEIIFVDDGSTDDSFPLMEALALRDPHVKIVKLSRNFGHQPAVSAGLAAAKGDVMAIMDGDLQDPPEELHRFFEKWREGYHVVYAIREKRKENWFKRLGYKTFYRLLAAVSVIKIPLDSGDFCVMDKKVADALVAVDMEAKTSGGHITKEFSLSIDG